MPLMKDELFNAQLLRTLGYAPYGGADVAEGLTVAGEIDRVDLDLWYEKWLGLADRVAADADRSHAAGRLVSARGAWLRASNYYRTAWLFHMGVPLEARVRAAHAREVECFRAGAALLDSPPLAVELPYNGQTMPGYWFQPPTAPDSAAPGRPTLILLSGYDGTAEELYFTNGAAALSRGYNVLAFEGPGQGTMLLERGVPMRHDWENVLPPVVDWVLAQENVDPARIALMGLSLGGYLAPRAVTGEHRIAACISDCGPYGVLEASEQRLPEHLRAGLAEDSGPQRDLLRSELGKITAEPTVGWAVRRSMLVHGLDDPVDFFRTTRSYSLRGLEQQITCPTLVCSAEDDHLSAHAHEFYDALTCPKEYIRFTAAEGAGEHCESGARTLFHERSFDWLDAVLAEVTAPAAG